MATPTKTKIDVLDHGYVRLVSYMQPAVPDDNWTGDLEVVRNARVSYDADWRDTEDASDKKLINYLYKNRHTSPFESMVFTFEVKAPIFVIRQWMRHRTWSYNEVSARYTQLPAEMYVPEPSKIGVQHSSNKQMREMDDIDRDEISAIIADHNERAYGLYEELIHQNVPRELARTVLPLSIYSRFFGTVNLHNFLKFLMLRDHPHAQHEIQVYAQAMWELIRELVPYTANAYAESKIQS